MSIAATAALCGRRETCASWAGAYLKRLRSGRQGMFGVIDTMFPRIYARRRRVPCPRATKGDWTKGLPCPRFETIDTGQSRKTCVRSCGWCTLCHRPHLVAGVHCVTGHKSPHALSSPHSIIIIIIIISSSSSSSSSSTKCALSQLIQSQHWCPDTKP